MIIKNNFAQLICGIVLICGNIYAQHPRQTNLNALNVFTISTCLYKNNSYGTSCIHSIIKAIEKNNPITDIFYLPLNSQTNNNFLCVKKGVRLSSGIKQVSICYPGFSQGKIPLVPRQFNATRHGSGLKYAHGMLSNTFLHGTIVTCDAISQRKYFNFGQDLDMYCFSKLHQQIVAQAPHARIILFGTCLGAFNILRFAQTNPENIDTLVLHSSVFSGRRMIQQLSRHYITTYSNNTIPHIAYKAFSAYFPNFDPTKDTLEYELDNIRGYNILITHYEYDEFISNEDLQILISKLQKHNNVQLITTADPRARHSYFSEVPEVIEKTNDFYKKFGLLSSATV